MNRILVIAPQFIGDSILTIPFLRELKKHVGRCEIDVISKNAGCYVFSKCPYVSSVYDWKKLNIVQLRAKKYDKAYILKRSLSAAILAFLLGVKETIGFDGQFREIFLKKTVKYSKYESKHELEHFMDVLAADYVEVNNKNLEFYVNDESLDVVKKYLGTRKKALIVACSSTYVKDWNKESFAKVVDYLDDKGYDSYFVGLDADRFYCTEIINMAESRSAKNLCGVLNLDEAFALISQMDIIFGVDSGFCHVGAAFNKKVVTLFGPTSVDQWKPINGSIVSVNKICSPCEQPKKCKNNFECMNEITVEHVVSALEKIL